MNYYGVVKFEKWPPLFKALWSVVITTLAFEVTRMDFPTTAEEFRLRGQQLAVTVGLAVYVALKNLFKNRKLRDNPLPDFIRAWMALVLVPLLGLSGCATLGVAGVASSAKQTTRETTHDENGNANTFEHITEAKGEVDKALFDFQYKGHPDESWEMSIGQDSEGVTSPAMQAAIMANTMQMQAFADIVKALVPLIPGAGAPAGGGVTLPVESPEFELPAELPTDLAGWIAFARANPELMQALEGLRP
ncbi:MAG: hypothetical protein HYV27_15370 [Candidatus Hydrogenedentes bacterium]|nr:hypothetical protein [Candidatus Hydrogenedentota bacterium]